MQGKRPFFEISQIIGMHKNETLSNRHLVTYYRILKMNKKFEKYRKYLKTQSSIIGTWS